MLGMHEGKNVLVTGGSNGIGRGIVERFIKDGANVLIADIDSKSGEELVKELGSKVIFHNCNVVEESNLLTAINMLVKEFGSLDIMINNAGYAIWKSILDTPTSEWKNILDINLTSIFLGTKLAARQMTKQGNGGCIVNASSGGGRHGVANVSHYCATKAAIIMFSQSAALEFAKDRIRVNCYAPGHIETPMMDNLLKSIAEKEKISNDEAYKKLLETVPWGRWGKPSDVANAVSWYCSDDAEYITGQCFAMNGGELPW